MESPSSPKTSRVEFKDCVEELIKFTLQSRLNQTLELDIGLSEDFCSNLIQQFEGSSNFSPYPRYKILALAFCEFLTSGALNGRGKDMMLAVKAIDFSENEVLYKMILEYGTQIQNILETVNFELHVQEPYFAQLKDGVKTVEGRCAVGDYNRIGSGAQILINKCVMLEVQDVHQYTSFSEMLQVETLAKVLPGIQNLEEGIQVYRKFYTEEKERSNGVLAICVDKTTAQPYISMARLLSGLGYNGIQSLLSFGLQEV